MILFGTGAPQRAVAATVFDHGNGSYEAIALIVDPGKYSLTAIVERTLCEGMKDPTPEFQRQRKCTNYYIKFSSHIINGTCLIPIFFPVIVSMMRNCTEL